jgi:molybdopterin converting factor small subunit
MKVLVKFFVFDLPPGFRDAWFELPDDALVNDVFDACFELFKQRNVTMDENELRTAQVLIGGTWSSPEDPVSDGDTITILRPMDGG